MTIESWISTIIVIAPVITILILAAVVVFGPRSSRIARTLDVNLRSGPMPWPRLPQPAINQAEFDRGHKWAESVIRTDGEGAIEMLEEFVDAEREFGRFSDFDRGVRQAIAESQTSAQIEQEQQDRGSVRAHVAACISALTVDDIKCSPFDQGYFETKDALEKEGSEEHARAYTLIRNDGSVGDPWRPLRCNDYLEGCAQAIYEWEQEQK